MYKDKGYINAIVEFLREKEVIDSRVTEIIRSKGARPRDSGSMIDIPLELVLGTTEKGIDFIFYVMTRLEPLNKSLMPDYGTHCFDCWLSENMDEIVQVKLRELRVNDCVPIATDENIMKKRVYNAEPSFMRDLYSIYIKR